VTQGTAGRGQPLSIRLAALLSVAVLAVLLVTGLAVNRFVSRSLEDELNNAQRQQVAFLADRLAELRLPFITHREERFVAASLSRLASFVRGRVMLVTADGDEVQSGGQLPRGVETTRLEEPIPGGDGLTLIVELPETPQPFLRVFNATLVVAGILSVLVLVIAAALLSDRLTRPLRGVAAAAHRLRAGDLSSRASGGPDRESAELADAFNAMASRLERSEALRRRAASDVAHDLATPATVLESQLQAMIDGVVPADAEQLEHARAAAGAMSGVVAQLRDLVDVEGAALQRQEGDVSPSRLVADARNALEPLYRERRVTLVAASIPDVLVRVDPVQVGRALRNVLTNAAEHAPPGSDVTLAAEATPTTVTIRITDAGPGIAAADLPHVFERFYRADRSRQPGATNGGSGIGLTIARELLAANGGSIEVERTDQGGTTFAIGLPISWPDGG